MSLIGYEKIKGLKNEQFLKKTILLLFLEFLSKKSSRRFFYELENKILPGERSKIKRIEGSGSQPWCRDTQG
jgi:hypothetical protein